MAGQQRRAKVDDPVAAVIEPALKVGAACGKSRSIILCFLLVRLAGKKRGTCIYGCKSTL